MKLIVEWDFSSIVSYDPITILCMQLDVVWQMRIPSSTFTKFVQTYTVNCHSSPKVHFPWILGHWTNTAWILALNQGRFDIGSTEKNMNHCLQLRISQSQTISCFLKHASSFILAVKFSSFTVALQGSPPTAPWECIEYWERRKAAFIARLFFPPWGTLIYIKQKGTRG